MSQREEYHLPESVHLIRIDDRRAVLSGPDQDHLLEGEAVDLVAESVSLLRNGTTTSGLAEDLEVPHQVAEQLTAQLRDSGILRLEAGTDDDLIEWMSAKPRTTRAELTDAAIGILTDGSIPASPLEALQVSIRTRTIDTVSMLAEDLSPHEVLLSVAHGEAPEFHRSVLREVWKKGVRWLPIRFADSEIRLGPLSSPDRKECYNCYYQRLLASTSDPEVAEQRHQHVEQCERSLHPPPVDSLIWSLASIEAVSILAPDQSPRTAGGVVAVDPKRMEVTTSSVLKIPGCETCGKN